MDKIKETFKNFLNLISTLLLSLVPLFKSCPPCPLCMPKYAAILSFFGIPLAEYNHILTPLMLISMVATVISLAYQAKKYHFSYFSTILAASACLWIVGARYGLENIELSYVGMGALLVSIVKNQKDLSSKKTPCCPH
ncbi:Uncharacterized protein AB751O23_AA_00140 [Chlamydiales bacterium SCGC AB-751-O23]|jgi:hypothetical protein|nr:Uncharacterized protein AB751O23_AA_00140 [Chlamydiales bacterium SCGC AB-751-O23]